MEKTLGERCVRFKNAAFAVAVCLLFCIASFAQLPTAKIVGTAKDASGASVPNASVKVTNTDTNITRTLTTDSDRSYNALELPTGNYQVIVTVPGFKKYIRQNIAVPVEQTVRIDVVLEVGSNAESVTVTETAALLKTESGELSHNVAADTLRKVGMNVESP